MVDHTIEQYAQNDPIVLFNNKQIVYVYKENILESVFLKSYITHKNTLLNKRETENEMRTMLLNEPPLERLSSSSQLKLVFPHQWSSQHQSFLLL